MNCTNCGNRENCFFMNSEYCPGWIPESRPAPNEEKINSTGEDGLFELILSPFTVIEF